MSFSSIPWKKYSEVEVQEIILQCFEYAGYTTLNIHKSDPAGEKGVDLLVELDGRKTAIAVKMKPRGVDRSQLQDLSEYSSEKKLYVFLQTPTHEFIKYMQRKDIKKNIEFWSNENIGIHLFELNPYAMSDLSLSYSEFSFRCIAIALTLLTVLDEAIQLEEDKHRDMVAKVDTTILKNNTLWEAKDHSAALSKSMWIQRTLFEHLRDREFTTTQQLGILESVQDVLTDSCKIILDRFEWVLEDLVKQFKPNFIRVASSTRYRTSWKYIKEFLKNISGLFPSKVVGSLMEMKAREVLWKGLKTEDIEGVIDFTGRLEEIRSSFSPGLAGIKFFFAQVSLLAWGIEEIVNDLYLSIADGGFDGHFRDWMKSPNGTWEGPHYQGLSRYDSLFRESIGRNDFGLSNPNIQILEEAVKTRWHIVTESKSFICPKCQTNLNTALEDGRIAIACSECDYTFK